MSGDPTFGIAFGGGGARGLAHIHVIEALDELGIRPKTIAGSSIGAMMGAGMAAGMTGAEIHEFARATLGRRTEVASRIWRARPGTWAEMVGTGIRITQFNVERIMRSFLPEAVPQTFAELKIPLKVTATDFYGHRLVVLTEGDLHTALAASAAIPGVFRPVRHQGTLLVDGGFFDPVPFDLIRGEADIVIAVDVVGGPERSLKMPNSIDMMLGASQLMMQCITALKRERHPPDIFLRPPVSGFRVLDFLKVDTVMAETAAIKDELKRAVEHLLTERQAALR